MVVTRLQTSKIHDTKGTGWRINGLYEFNPMGGNFAHGISIGYISLSASEEYWLNRQSKAQSILSLFTMLQKYMFGNDKIKAFIKGALGMQFAGLKREGLISLSDNDFGFYGGGGAGIMIFLKENIFINA